MAIGFTRCQLFNPQPMKKMPIKKKSPATKFKVELKDLKPRKDAKGGAASTGCVKAAVITKAYCSGIVG